MILRFATQTTLLARLHFIVRVVPAAFFVRWLVGGIPFYGVVVVAALVHARMDATLRHTAECYRLLLLYAVVFLNGVGGIWNAIGHSVLADQVAQSIGWAPGSPFQLELAAAHLAWAVVSLAALYLHSDVLVAVIISKAVFLFGAAAVHVNDLVANRNVSPGNAGFATLVFGDLVFPAATLVVVALWYSRRRAEARAASARPPVGGPSAAA